MDISANGQHDKKISNPRLAVTNKKCPECDITLIATGDMYHSTVTKDWFIEYWCPEDKEKFEELLNSYFCSAKPGSIGLI